MNIFKSFLCVIVALTATNLKSYAESDDGTIVEDICLPLDSATLEEIIPIYFSNDIPPSFPGGEDALYKFIAENLRYPKEAQENHIEERVFVSFMVSEKGELSDFNVEEGKNQLLINEAIRVVKLLPNFIPATKTGVPFKQKLLLPINFRLNSKLTTDSTTSVSKDAPLPLDSAAYDFCPYAQPPSFPGGDDALFEFLNKNLRYPQEAQENNIEGIVIVSFMVSEKGELSDFNVERGENLPLNNEAIRVAKLMPNFNPAITKYGEAIKYKYLIPVHFKLEEINQADSISSDSNEITEVLVNTTYYNNVYGIHEPFYPGGVSALNKFLIENIHYPEEAIENNISGKVLVSFKISGYGHMYDLKIEEGENSLLNNEVIRVVKLLQIIPARNWLAYKFKLPIYFGFKHDLHVDHAKDIYIPIDSLKVEKFLSL